MASSPTQPDQAEGPKNDGQQGPGGASTPAPAEGGDDAPGEQPGSPRG